MRLFRGKKQREIPPEGDGPHHPFMKKLFEIVRKCIGEEVAILDMVATSWEEDRDWCIFTTEQPIIAK